MMPEDEWDPDLKDYRPIPDGLTAKRVQILASRHDRGHRRAGRNGDGSERLRTREHYCRSSRRSRDAGRTQHGWDSEGSR